MLGPFDASRLKVRRARMHYGDLQVRIREFLAREPFYAVIEEAPGWWNNRKWAFHVREEVPDDWAPIIGDCIHNLRAALDLMACELVRANGQSDKGVYFPFGRDAVGLDQQIADKRFNRASPIVVDFLRHQVKPFRVSNPLLRAIHDLDIMDKHQALIPTSDMMGAPDIPGYPIIGPRMTMGPIRSGMGIAVPAEHTSLPIGTIGGGHFRLSFPPTTPLAGGEIIPVLIDLSNAVDKVVEDFAAL